MEPKPWRILLNVEGSHKEFVPIDCNTPTDKADALKIIKTLPAGQYIAVQIALDLKVKREQVEKVTVE